MIAPIATSSEPSVPPMIATIGISVSGIAVPTAASRLPTAPSPISSLWPIHSTAFVKKRAPAEQDREADCEEENFHQATKKVIPRTA